MVSQNGEGEGDVENNSFLNPKHQKMNTYSLMDPKCVKNELMTPLRVPKWGPNGIQMGSKNEVQVIIIPSCREGVGKGGGKGGEKAT